MQSHKGGEKNANFKKASFRISNKLNTFNYLSNVPTCQFFASRETYRKSSRTKRKMK